MNSKIFDGIWEFARELTVFSPDNSESRQFLGFLEPLSLTDFVTEKRVKPFVLPTEKFCLIAHPEEDFFGGTAARVSCMGEDFELLSVKPVYLGREICHRECMLLRTGGEGDG